MQCYSNAECQGNRTCSEGWCSGKHNCTGLFANDQGFKYDTVETGDYKSNEQEKFVQNYGIASA